jgi:hypothetical protein
MGRPESANGETVDKSAMLERMKAMSTGSETVIIPVGIQMLTMGADRQPQEASLEDIKANTMVSVWLDESVTDRKIASFVMISN